MSKKEFDRSVAFTFYREWAEMAGEIEADYGKETMADFLMAIVNYALYQIEPEKKAPLKYFWPQTAEKINASQAHRAQGFSRENTDLTESIRLFKEINPDMTQRDIAASLGCSLGKVNKALKDFDPNTTTGTPTNTTTSTSTAMNMNVNTEDKFSAVHDKGYLVDESTGEVLEATTSTATNTPTDTDTSTTMNVNKHEHEHFVNIDPNCIPKTNKNGITVHDYEYYCGIDGIDEDDEKFDIEEYTTSFIWNLAKMNPGASYEEIAETVGCSLERVIDELDEL